MSTFEQISYAAAVTSAAEGPSANPRATVAPRERDDFYYKLIAGSPHTRLLESTFDLRLPHILAEHKPLTIDKIAKLLNLHMKRASK